MFKAKISDSFTNAILPVGQYTVVLLNDTAQINLGKASSREFYKLLDDKTHIEIQTDLKRWSKNLSLGKDSWSRIFKSPRQVCKEVKRQVFQFKVIHRSN